MDISDKVSQRLHGPHLTHREVSRLRYASDYGHGFLGLFRALFNGDIEAVVRDPGPPYIDEKDIPMVVRTLYSFLKGTEYERNIPKKYRIHLADYKPIEPSSDSLFPSD